MDEPCFVVSTILAIGLVVGKGAVHGPESCKKSDCFVCLISLSQCVVCQATFFLLMLKIFSKQTIILLFAASEPKKGELRKFSDKPPGAEVVDHLLQLFLSPKTKWWIS